MARGTPTFRAPVHTLAYALHAPRAGELAWVVENFWEWTDPTKELPDEAVDRGQSRLGLACVGNEALKSSSQNPMR